MHLQIDGRVEVINVRQQFGTLKIANNSQVFHDRNSCKYINYYTGENTKINLVNIDQDCISELHKKTSQIVTNEYRHRVAREVVDCKIRIRNWLYNVLKLNIIFRISNTLYYSMLNKNSIQW